MIWVLVNTGRGALREKYGLPAPVLLPGRGEAHVADPAANSYCPADPEREADLARHKRPGSA